MPVGGMRAAAHTPYTSSAFSPGDARRSQKDVAVECSGYILEELRDEANFEQFKKDVGEANIFIGSLIFVQVLSVAV